MRVTNFLLLVASLTIGCSDSIIYKVSDAKPRIVVYPEKIDFGNLTSGFESEQEEIVIVNAGDADLVLLSPVLFDMSTRYRVIHEETLIIEPQETFIIEVFYTPETYEENEAFIRIESNDDTFTVIDIPVLGAGDAPVMSVEPVDTDYGLISIGCDNEERITIRNDGNMDLTIESITQMVTQPADILMEMGSLPSPPWELLPDSEIDFLISYIPTNMGIDESIINIVSNDPLQYEIETNQYGEGDVEQWFNQMWEQEEIPVLDVLWVVDNSGSMNQFQTNLATNIGSFITTFASSGADYRMAVITTDRYTFSTVLDPSHPDPESELASLVITGTNGSGMEKGIAMAGDSLSNSTAAGPGGIFFRAHAKLIVIFVSDEQDWSTPGWASYLSFFDNLKPHGDFIPYGVIGDHPSGCGLSNQHATFGAGYWDLIDYYNGSWYSICAANWGVQLQDLAGEVTGIRMFVLDEPDPIIDTIVVSVNGQQTDEWEYVSATNSFVFTAGHVPEEGQTIEVNYAVWGCYE